MPRFVNQTFIVLVLVLLGFDGSLTTISVSMNNQPCIVYTAVVEVVILLKIHLVEYVCLIKLGVNLKVFNMIKGINE